MQIQCPTFPVNDDGSINADKKLLQSASSLKTYLVGKPSTYCCSLTGRATKGYVAFDITRERLVFLKDAWRANSDQIHPELDTYILLNGKKVCYVPTALGGGDVSAYTWEDKSWGPPQSTLTQSFLNDPLSPLEHVHCRLILKELGRPLESYTDSAELMLVFGNAVDGKLFHTFSAILLLTQYRPP